MKVAILPARGGSKRIPGKNLRPFAGRPIIGYSIECALHSGVFDRVIVSTDDDAIAETALRLGAEVPFRRPADFSDDHTGTAAVIEHARDWLRAQGAPADAICCIYPTAPFIRAADLRRGLELLEQGDWRFVFAAAAFRAPVFRSFSKNARGGLEMLFPQHFQSRSQDLPSVFHDAGQFCWGRPEAWEAGARVFEAWSTIVEIPSWRVQDIDTPDDWLFAELIFEAARARGG
jgi:N-acylneuraminate cytidylyltransferase